MRYIGGYMDIWMIILTVALLVLEYFLGETKMVKPNSLLSAVLEAAKKILVFFKEQKEEKKE